MRERRVVLLGLRLLEGQVARLLLSDECGTEEMRIPCRELGCVLLALVALHLHLLVLLLLLLLLVRSGGSVRMERHAHPTEVGESSCRSRDSIERRSGDERSLRTSLLLSERTLNRRTAGESERMHGLRLLSMLLELESVLLGLVRWEERREVLLHLHLLLLLLGGESCLLLLLSLDLLVVQVARDVQALGAGTVALCGSDLVLLLLLLLEGLLLGEGRLLLGELREAVLGVRTSRHGGIRVRVLLGASTSRREAHHTRLNEPIVFALISDASTHRAGIPTAHLIRDAFLLIHRVLSGTRIRLKERDEFRTARGLDNSLETLTL